MKRHVNALGVAMIVGVVLSSAAYCAQVESALPPNTRLQDVAKITNSRDASVAVLSVAIGPKDEILGVYSVYEMNDGTGDVIRDLMPLSEIQSPQGSVLHEENGMKIFILQGTVDADRGTARLQIRYMTNGITRSYDSCRLNATRSAQGTWNLINAYTGKIVTEAHAKTWALGIRTIENVCPAK
jgi:hypothetical protein